MSMVEAMETTRGITLCVNGVTRECDVEPRRSLLDCLREDLHLHGTHAGCEHGVCGSCNVLVDGEVVRACLMFAIQADGASVETVEGLEQDGQLHPLQEAFCDQHALQCGYCTPGMLISAVALLRKRPRPTDDELIDALAGNLCRCTGYQQIIAAVRQVAPKPETSER